MIDTATNRAFGEGNPGLAFGVFGAAWAAGTIVGPLLVGPAFDLFGSWAIALGGLAIPAFGALLLTVTNRDLLHDCYEKEIGKRKSENEVVSKPFNPNEKRIETTHLVRGSGTGHVTGRPTGNLWPGMARASQPLEFVQPLPKDAARSEVLSFVAQQHDAHLFLVANVWDHLVDSEPETFEGPSWNTFAKRFVDALERGFEETNEEHARGRTRARSHPRRSMEVMLERRRAHFLVDMRLMLRRLAHYMAVTVEQRLEWQRLMTRTRCLDAALKDIFTQGVETPDGGKFGGKGFRSTWQEGVVAVATALNRQPDAPRDARPGQGYDGDLVAPMIRDVGLGLAMGDTPLDVMAANLGKAGSNQNGGWDDAGGRPPRWCVACRCTPTNRTAPHRQRNHDRFGVCSMAPIAQPFSCSLHRRRCFVVG